MAIADRSPDQHNDKDVLKSVSKPNSAPKFIFGGVLKSLANYWHEAELSMDRAPLTFLACWPKD